MTKTITVHQDVCYFHKEKNIDSANHVVCPVAMFTGTARFADQLTFQSLLASTTEHVAGFHVNCAHTHIIGGSHFFSALLLSLAAHP